jgi:hypothetical protein
MTTSENRLAANRANAAKSTGPRTNEGKARSSQNAMKHGISATTFAVPGLDEPDTFANLRDDAVRLYQPRNPQERFAVDRIALAQQALLRCSQLEAGLFANAMEDPSASAETPLPQSQRLARGFQRDLASWKLFLRYQAQAERQYRRAVQELAALQAIPQEEPNEPNETGEPLELEQIAAPLTLLMPPTPRSPAIVPLHLVPHGD